MGTAASDQRSGEIAPRVEHDPVYQQGDHDRPQGRLDAHQRPLTATMRPMFACGDDGARVPLRLEDGAVACLLRETCMQRPDVRRLRGGPRQPPSTAGVPWGGHRVLRQARWRRLYDDSSVDAPTGGAVTKIRLVAPNPTPGILP